MTSGAIARASGAAIRAVGAENEYADILKQIGGSHVTVDAVISNPNTDPHTYESSVADARAVASAQLVVQNGLGYDAFMGHLEAASPSPRRVAISVGEGLGHHDGDNPHIWYDPGTMPYVAARASAVFSRLDPRDAAYFRANLRRFDASMSAYTGLLAAVKERFAGTPIAVTEPVFGYAARAAGLKVLTPQSFQLAIQEGNDPSPQDVQTEESLLVERKVRMFAYNQQAVAPITARLIPLARAHHIPIVGVYETEPPDKDYQQWMVAEMQAVERALGRGISTEVLR